MILGQVDLEWYHYAGAGVVATLYGIARVWIMIRKQKADEKIQDSQTKFYERTTEIGEENGRHLVTLTERLDSHIKLITILHGENKEKLGQVCKYGQPRRRELGE